MYFHVNYYKSLLNIFKKGSKGMFFSPHSNISFNAFQKCFLNNPRIDLSYFATGNKQT